MTIRPAEKKDACRINDLLYQVQNIHAAKRPDIFKTGHSKKYTDSELIDIIEDEKRPIFVCLNDDGLLIGYCFCIIQETMESICTNHMITLYIDDLCVDEKYRRSGIGKNLYEYVKKYALENKFYRITLNVWEMNPGARKFYEKMGLLPLKTTMEDIL